MTNYLFENTTLNRLPVIVSGLTHVEFNFALEVYPKLNNQISSK